jgi:septal ring factor EnvC (AmiA/AmiB activator)
MNLLGKIFAVSIAVLAIILMAFSMVVYTTHRNWKDDAEQLSDQLSQAQARNAQLESSYRSLDSQLKAEIEASLQEVRKLETERVELMGQNTAFQRELDQLRQRERTSTAAVASTQANNETLASEVNSLRGEIRENQSTRDSAFATMVSATDQLHQSQGRLSSLEERNRQLAQDLGGKIHLLREEGIDPDMDPEAVVPGVRGQVKATRQAAGTQLIEISIGSDDGLRTGNTVEVYRGERYLGRAEIIKTEPDRAVGRVLREFQQGQIQEGDHVATRFRVG